MDWAGCAVVETIPGKVSGTPLVRHTRVPAQAVLDDVEAGVALEEVADLFDLPAADVRALILFATARHAENPV